jgi:WD40 repeat protein
MRITTILLICAAAIIIGCTNVRSVTPTVSETPLSSQPTPQPTRTEPPSPTSTIASTATSTVPSTSTQTLTPTLQIALTPVDALSLIYTFDLGTSVVLSAKWTSENTIAVVQAAHGVSVIDVNTHTVTPLFSLGGHSPEPYVLAWSEDGSMLLTGDWGGEFFLWDLNSGASTRVPVEGVYHPVSLSWSPDHDLLAIGYTDGTVVWDMISDQPVFRFDEYTSPVQGVAFSPDQTMLANGGEVFLGQEDELSLALWDLETGTQIDRAVSVGISDLAWSPDGKWLASAGGRLTVWDVDDLSLELFSSPVDVGIIAWSPDSAMLVADDSMENIVLWDFERRIIAQTRPPSPSRVTSFSWNADSSMLAVGEWQGRVDLYQILP